MDTTVYTIPEFCTAHRLSRALLYLFIRDGRGPAIMKVGRRRLISVEAAAEWRQRMQADTPDDPQ